MEERISGFGDAVQGFTPVRRKPTTIATRQVYKDEQGWTAARCNRLLRALKSRVAILNKDLSRVQKTLCAREPSIEVKFGATRKAPHDDDWTQARKKVKRTYSTRGGKVSSSQATLKATWNKDIKGFVPGEIAVPTPILNRARGNITFTAPYSRSVEVCEDAAIPTNLTKGKDGHSKDLCETLRSIRKQTPASRYTIYEGIYSGLESLLKATTLEDTEPSQRGPKSLLSICLEKVPRYIAHEENMFAAHMEATGSKSAINDRDISTEIYDDLEAFGSNGRGWKYLRKIVRSHGIQVISDAIVTGSLDAEFVGILVTLCIHTKAIKEAEILLSSLLSIACFPEPKNVFSKLTDEPSTCSLSILWRFVETTGTFSFQFRELCVLLSGGLLPLGWLASKKFGSVWTKAISHDSANTDASNFLNTALPLLAQTGSSGGVKDTVITEATKHTFSSLLTTLLSIVILSHDSTTQLRPESIESYSSPYDHFVTLIRGCLIEFQLSYTLNIQGLLLVMANIILNGLRHDGSPTDLELTSILFSHLKQLKKSTSCLPSYHDAVSFICSVSRCCGRGTSSSGFKRLGDLHQILESVLPDSESEGATILREVIADSALAFAQEAPDQIHLDYAAMMEGKVHRVEKPKANFTPGRPMTSARIGFRWEEGISEWVAATPTTNPSDLRSFSAIAPDNTSETPLRPSLRQRSIRQAPLNLRARALLSTNSGSASIKFTSLDTSSPLRRTAVELEFPPSDIPDGQLEVEGFGDELTIHSSEELDLQSDADSSVHEKASVTPERNRSVIFHELEDEPQFLSDPPAYDGSEDSPGSSVQSDELSGVFADESFTSVASSAMFYDSCDNGRRYIDRAPRLSRRVLRKSLQWQLFDESDDELSFVSVSSENNSILRDITDSVRPNTRGQRHRKVATKQQTSFAAMNASALADSEDELGI